MRNGIRIFSFSGYLMGRGTTGNKRYFTDGLISDKQVPLGT